MTLLELRVSPFGQPDVHRTFELAGSLSLHHLHSAIQSAFEFDDDHEYAFFMNGNPWDNEFGYWSSPSSASEKSTATSLDRLALRPNKKFLYLFDYGDEHVFWVKVTRIGKDERGPSQPKLVGSAGQGPVQYSTLDEDEEEDACGHAPPDPELAGLARRLEPHVMRWTEQDEEDDEHDHDHDHDHDADDTAVSREPAPAAAPNLREEHDLAVEMLERCNDDAARVHQHIEHVVEGDVIGWLTALPGRIVEEQGDVQAAIALTKRLLVMLPEPPLRLLLSAFLALDGQTAETRASLDALLEDEPEDPFVAFRVGAILVELGDLPRAEQCFREALRFAGSDRWLREQARDGLSSLLVQLGRDDEAEEVVRTEERRAARAGRQSGAVVSPTEPVVVGAKPGRNDPCPCGSSKKFKKCCGAS